MKRFLPVYVLLLFCACSGGGSHPDKMIFRYNEASGITSLDPVKANSLANIWAVQQLYNGLVQLDSTLQVKPCIASSWEIRDSGRVYIFHLRRDIYFHRDDCFQQLPRRLVAADVVFSFQRLVSENGPQWIFGPVAEDSSGRKLFQAPDDSTVTIQLRTAYAQFLQVLTMPYCYVVAPEAVERYGKNFGRHPVGTGPFFMRRWVENEKLVLNRNDDYFERDASGQSLPYLDGVAITFVRDRQTMFLEFLEGRIDLMSGLDQAYKDELLDPYGQLVSRYASRMYLQKIPYLNTEYLGIQLEAGAGGPLMDKHIRKALHTALDRDKLISYVRNGIGLSAEQGFVPPGLISGRMPVSVSNREQEVQKHIAASSYGSIDRVPEMVLYTDVAYTDMCTAILNQWRDAGFRVRMEVLDRPTLKSQVAKGQLFFFRASWIADYPDAENYLALFYSANFSPAGPNYTHFRSAVYDDWYKACSREEDVHRRHQLYRAMDSLVMEELPVIPLYFDEVTRFVRKEVQGLPPHPMNHLDLRRVRKVSR